jgi:hypothetical protein
VNRTLTIRYEDGSPVESFRKVTVRGQSGRFVQEYPDSSGSIYFEWDDNWIDCVMYGDEIAKSDWSLGGSGLGDSKLELTIPRD